jgi:cyclopropane fatty-acyl-phospholipid synthase-like methyltransferase
MRIHKTKTAINSEAVADFFNDRAKRFDPAKPLVSVIYQDRNPELAEARDRHEKELIVPQLELKPLDRVLDVGCGIGRWADALRGKIARYHGTDLAHGLTNIARDRFGDSHAFTFQTLTAQESTASRLTYKGPFDLVIVTGLFIYLNDDECLQVLAQLGELAAPQARILLREPIAVGERLTLQNIWSEELQYHYSAIYRPLTEYESMITKTLKQLGFYIAASNRLFPPELANRQDTTQHYLILRRNA